MEVCDERSFLADGRADCAVFPVFPESHGKPRVDDRRVLSGIIFVNRNGLRWRDAPAEYGPHKTLYNRWKCWSDRGIFARMFLELAQAGEQTGTVMIDATYLKAHRTAASLRLKKHQGPSDRTDQRRAKHQTARCHRWSGPTHSPVHDCRTELRLNRRAGAVGGAAKGTDHARGSGV